jgi:2-desacetyl-2-hydroxyethyl bacteriochlorophyllide A dehydrogenase
MRAFVVTGPRESAVIEVDAPAAGPGQVVVDVHRAGICGTDVEFFTGEMAYLHQGHAHFPLRLGHEWMGVVSSVGAGVDESWLGRRVTGDTMLGCGRCRLCTSGRQHVCHDRFEIGIRGGWPGALAEQLPVPVTALHVLPDSVDDTAGALVEPGGNAMRSVRAAGLEPGAPVLVLGPGTIGLLTALIAAADGLEVHLAGRRQASLDFARGIGVAHTWTLDALPDVPFDAIIDCTSGVDMPAQAVQRVEPGGRVVLVGLSGSPSHVDTRDLALKDVTAVGILSASPGLAATIDHYADGRVDPRPIVAGTVGLDQVAAALAGEAIPGVGIGPKIHIDPRT